MRSSFRPPIEARPSCWETWSGRTTLTPASHSRHVVELTIDVADRLGLDSRSRHLAELTALLHDVGKIKIPNTIINKPGPLTDDERAIVNTHTIEGERFVPGRGIAEPRWGRSFAPATNGMTGTAIRTVWPAMRFRSSLGSSAAATRSTRWSRLGRIGPQCRLQTRAQSSSRIAARSSIRTLST